MISQTLRIFGTADRGIGERNILVRNGSKEHFYMLIEWVIECGSLGIKKRNGVFICEVYMQVINIVYGNYLFNLDREVWFIESKLD